MYDETFSQFLQTMSGVLRAIAELEFHNPCLYKGRIGVVLVADGSMELNADFKNISDKCGLINKDILNQKS